MTNITRRAETGCWTCKERKVACDRQTPVCNVCTKSKRQCGGFGLRLSWPKENGSKRAIVYRPDSPHIFNRTHIQDAHYVHVSSRDIGLHESATLLPGGIPGMQIRNRIRQCLPPSNKPWTFAPDTQPEEGLLEYFRSSVINLLAVLDSNPQTICRILMQLAFSDNTYASNAVLNSILAVASLLRDGQKAHTAQYKRQALDALLASTEEKEHTTLQGSIRHVAAGILLCTFEMQQIHEEHSQWVGHVCGTQGFIRSLEKLSHHPGGDESIILGWALYYDVLSRFSLRHWNRPELIRMALDLAPVPKGSNVCALQFFMAKSAAAIAISNVSSYAHPVLSLLNEICNISLDSSEPRYHTKKYQNYLTDLRIRLAELPITTDDRISADDPVTLARIELYKLAALVYLERVSKNFSGESKQLDSWITRGYEIFATLDTCTWPFPLFILGCEADTDQRRAIMLELLARTGQKPYIMHLRVVSILIETAWIQRDLDVDGIFNYVHRLNVAVGSSDTFPAFL